MNTNARDIETRVIALFKTHCVHVKVKPGVVSIEVEEGGLTYAQMHELAAILETDRIDFRSYTECTFGGSDVTPASYDSGLRITARPQEA